MLLRNQVTRIRTRQQYEAALARFNELTGSIPGSPEAAEMDELALALDRYDDPFVTDLHRFQSEALTKLFVAVGSLVGGFVLGNAIYKILV